MTDILKTAAYGGKGWSPRTTSLRQEVGGVWGACGVAMEWSPLKTVLLHQPGPELSGQLFIMRARPSRQSGTMALFIWLKPRRMASSTCGSRSFL